MAEALTQPPLKAHATPQLSVKTQRLEELTGPQKTKLLVLKSGRKNGVSSNHNKDKLEDGFQGTKKSDIRIRCRKEIDNVFRLIKKKTSTTNASLHPASVPMEKPKTLTNEAVDSHAIENEVTNGGTNDTIKQPVDPKLSGGMNGYILPCNSDTNPSSIFRSPVNGLEDIMNNKVLYVVYKFEVASKLGEGGFERI
ncbi:hypothetical protein ACFE04_007642 [Oxalis oulophora]